jgi:hypothetical protein
MFIFWNWCFILLIYVLNMNDRLKFFQWNWVILLWFSFNNWLRVSIIWGTWMSIRRSSKNSRLMICWITWRKWIIIGIRWWIWIFIRIITGRWRILEENVIVVEWIIIISKLIIRWCSIIADWDEKLNFQNIFTTL